MAPGGLVALILLADAGATAPDAGAGPTPVPVENAAPAPGPPPSAAEPVAPEPELESAPAPEPPPPRRRLYGDRGRVELGVGLTYSSRYGIAAMASARYFVIDRVAPGLEGLFVSGGSDASRYGMLLAAVRVVPLRFSHAAL